MRRLRLPSDGSVTEGSLTAHCRVGNHFSTAIRPVTPAGRTSPRNQFREKHSHNRGGGTYAFSGSRATELWPAYSAARRTRTNEFAQTFRGVFCRCENRNFFGVRFCRRVSLSIQPIVFFCPRPGWDPSKMGPAGTQNRVLFGSRKAGPLAPPGLSPLVATSEPLRAPQRSGFEEALGIFERAGAAQSAEAKTWIIKRRTAPLLQKGSPGRGGDGVETREVAVSPFGVIKPIGSVTLSP